MIIVSASMKKAGSGWYFNLTNDLLVASGQPSVREIRDRYGLHGLLKGGNCQVDMSHILKAPRLLAPILRGHSFTVKTHGRPRWGLPFLLRTGAVKATYIFRDPRDIAISMLDHGKDLREAGKADNPLAHLHTLDDALEYIREDTLSIWNEWRMVPGVLLVRYEDVLRDARGELRRLASHLGLEVSDEVIDSIVARYDRQTQSVTSDENLHFNAGVANRFESVLSLTDQARCRQSLEPELSQMGYSNEAT